MKHARADSLAGASGFNADGLPPLFDTPVLKHQVRRVLRNCGFIDPTQIDHYLAQDGYSGLAKALAMSPEEIIAEIKRSGLRGRGGAGFPTWRKWQFCRDAKGDQKYLICNADEGDPGAFMNRSLLEGDPHALLEGMLIAGRAWARRTATSTAAPNIRWPWNASAWPSLRPKNTDSWARTFWTPASLFTFTSKRARVRSSAARRPR